MVNSCLPSRPPCRHQITKTSFAGCSIYMEGLRVKSSQATTNTLQHSFFLINCQFRLKLGRETMTMKIEIISRETIKPSSPTPDHLKNFKISLLDQLAPPLFVPVVLFYLSDELSSSNNVNHNEVSTVLKKSLSDTLTRFYPLAGRLEGNDSVDCNDDGVLYVEARANTELSEVLQNSDVNILQQFLPFDTNRVRSDKDVPITAVQVNILNCGSIAIGVCISHKIIDGASLATFLTGWSVTALGADEIIAPRLDSALLFPPKDINVMMPKGVISKEKTVTKRFVFDATKLALLRAKVSGAYPTRVEAVTSLIWKSAMAVSREKTGKASTSSIVTHVVNIRGKMEPPLPEHSLGNLWQMAVAPFVEEEGKVELQDLVGQLRQSIRKINGDYTRKLQGDDGLVKTRDSLQEVHELVGKGEVEFYRFSSWSRFPFYNTDFGFGTPTWVCTTNVPIKNVVVLMGMKSGDGIEAWVTMTEDDMAKFERGHELQSFTSLTP